MQKLAVLGLGLKLLASYLVGSINGALVLGRFRGIDIRAEGSGNAGATNALRTHGLPFALTVALIDIAKGAIAVALIAPAAAMDVPPVDMRWVAVLCGIAAVVGHIFPFWFDFRGGKGGATAVGAVAALSPLTLLPVLGAWLSVLLATGYVGLSTMMAALAIVIWPVIYRPQGVDVPLLAFGVAMTVLIVFAHRDNIRRMRAGAESRMIRRVLRRRQRQ